MNTICVGCLVDDASSTLRTLLLGTSISMVAAKRTLLLPLSSLQTQVAMHPLYKLIFMSIG